jgi:hypothetical protein
LFNFTSVDKFSNRIGISGNTIPFPRIDEGTSVVTGKTVGLEEGANVSVMQVEGSHE